MGRVRRVLSQATENAHTLAYLSFVVLPTAAPPGGHDSDAASALVGLCHFAVVFISCVFTFCPSVFFVIYLFLVTIYV